MSASSPPPHRVLLFKSISHQHELRFIAMLSTHRGKQQQQWKQKASPSRPSASGSQFYPKAGVAAAAAESIERLRIAETPAGGQQAWRPKAYTTAAGPNEAAAAVTTPEKEVPSLWKALRGPLGAEFNVDDSTFTQAQIRAAFYPKFENEKSDQEVRTRMMEMVSQGHATLEVSLKHSGSLFMYAGHKGGAYAKNSFGNIYTAVGVFVLGRMFNEACGTQARRMQSEFNDFLEAAEAWGREG